MLFKIVMGSANFIIKKMRLHNFFFNKIGFLNECARKNSGVTVQESRALFDIEEIIFTKKSIQWD